MEANFRTCLAWVLEHEGGYVNHKKDPGGPTNRGVTQRVYDAFRRRKGRPVQSVRHIDMAEVAEIYRKQYWDAVRGDDLPSGLDYAVFDYAVNSGPGRSAKHLQEVLGVGIDGQVGDITLNAARAAPVKETIQALCARRMRFVRGLRTWSTFGRGWTRRIEGRFAGAQDDDIGVLDRAQLLANAHLRPAAIPAPKPSAEPTGKARDEDTSAVAVAREAIKDPSVWTIVSGIGGTLVTIATSSGPIAWAVAVLLLIGGAYGLYRLERARRVAT